MLCCLLLVGGWLLLTGCRERTQPALPGSASSASTSDASSTPALFPVRQDSLWGYIDRQGRSVMDPQFDRAWRFSGDRALIRKNGRYGFIDTTGTVAIKPQYADAWHFSDGVAPVQKDSLWGFVNPTGEIVVAPQFDLAPGVVEEGAPSDTAFRRARVDGQYGYRNEDGEIVIEPQFEQAWTFSDGRARVMKNGRWGYVNRQGQLVIDPRFARAWDFRGGLARVELADGRLGYIDTTGTLVWPRP